MGIIRSMMKPFLSMAIWVVSSVIPMSASADSGCKNLNSGMEAMHQEEISILTGKGKIIRINSYIADNNEERASGYQHICNSVIDETTILFVYTKVVAAQFHMRNVKGALDIGFFDNNGVLIKSMLMDTYDDGNSRLYHPGKPFRFALEAKPGFFSSHNFTDGNTRLLINSLYDEG